MTEPALSGPRAVMEWAERLLRNEESFVPAGDDSMAIDKRGLSVVPSDPRAMQWSVYGAILAAPATPLDRKEALHLLAFVAPEKPHKQRKQRTRRSLLHMDDNFTHDQALSLLRAGIEQAKTEERKPIEEREPKYEASTKLRHRVFRRRR